MTREGHEDGNFNPAQSLGNIFNLISGLSSKIKAEGQYLLKRDAAKNAAFVQGVYSTVFWAFLGLFWPFFGPFFGLIWQFFQPYQWPFFQDQG